MASASIPCPGPRPYRDYHSVQITSRRSTPAPPEDVAHLGRSVILRRLVLLHSSLRASGCAARLLWPRSPELREVAEGRAAGCGHATCAVTSRREPDRHVSAGGPCDGNLPSACRPATRTSLARPARWSSPRTASHRGDPRPRQTGPCGPAADR